MKKKIILILSVLIALSSILFINLGNKSTAQECNDCTPIPTPPGDSNYSKINCNCTGAIPTIKASASTIASGGSITLWVDSGGKACPDFTWSVSNAKYTLNKSKTTNDLETVTLRAASGTCSSTGYNNSNIYVTVTVTDKCGITRQAIIMNTTCGRWGSDLGCSSGVGEAYSLSYKYYIRPSTQVLYRIEMIGYYEGTLTASKISECSLTAQNLNWYFCLNSQIDIPWATIESWLLEVLVAIGHAPYKACNSPATCKVWADLSTCTYGTHHTIGWGVHILPWECK
jgi:hypothetical protein